MQRPSVDELAAVDDRAWPVVSRLFDQVRTATALGARRVDVGQGADKTFIVMADVEGNEFCVLNEL